MGDIEFGTDSCVCVHVQGHHVSKMLRSPILGGEPSCETESANQAESYAVAVLKQITHKVIGGF